MAKTTFSVRSNAQLSRLGRFDRAVDWRHAFGVSLEPWAEISERLRRFFRSYCGYLGPVGKRATVLFVTLDHPVEGAAIDAEDLGGAGAVAARDLEDVKQVATFELVKRRQIFEECG